MNNPSFYIYKRKIFFSFTLRLPHVNVFGRVSVNNLVLQNECNIFLCGFGHFHFEVWKFRKFMPHFIYMFLSLCGLFVYIQVKVVGIESLFCNVEGVSLWKQSFRWIYVTNWQHPPLCSYLELDNEILFKVQYKVL